MAPLGALGSISLSSSDKSPFHVTFWGVRGTLATPGAEHNACGGNTSCVEVRCGERILIFDAGTGIRELGSKLIDGDPLELDLFLSHGHYDHVEGLPLFSPLYIEGCKIRIWAGPVDGADDTEELVSGFMRRPYFPVGTEVFKANMIFNDVWAGQTLDLGDGITVRTGQLQHPGGATGYRVEFDGRVFAYVCDTEHVPGTHDPNVIELIRDADLFVYDASFTDNELPAFTGYGHSTWQEGLRLSNSANAQAMMASHHMPFRNDQDIAMIEQEIRSNAPNSGVAREGMTIQL